MMQMSSSFALSLVLREEDDVKRVGSVTEHKHISASEAARKKGCHLFRSHSHRTRSCCSRRRDADHAEWRGWTNALSLSLRWRRGTWALSRQELACHRPLKSSAHCFISQIPGRKKTGGCKGQSRNLKRKLTASAEKQDWNARSAFTQNYRRHKAKEYHQQKFYWFEWLYCRAITLCSET